MRSINGSTPRWLASLLVGVSLLAGCAAKPQAGVVATGEVLPRPVVVPLREHNNHVYVRGAIDGLDAGWFLLDTGSQLDVISTGVAGRLELPRQGSGQARGIAGVRRFDYRLTRSFSFSAWPVPNTLLAALDLDEQHRGIGTLASGILGYTSLRTEPFTIDYPRGRLLIGVDPLTHGERLVGDGGLPMVRALVSGVPVVLMIDSGQDRALTLPQSLLMQHPDMLAVPHIGRSQAAGVGGRIGVTQSWVRSVEVLGTTLLDVEVSFEDGALGSFGRIGHGLLKDFVITFDYSRRLVSASFEPALNRDTQP